MNHIYTGQTTGIWWGKEVEMHNNARSNNAKRSKQNHEKAQHKKCNKLTKRSKKHGGKMQHECLVYFCVVLRAQALTYAPKTTHQSFLPAQPATSSTHENKTKKKTFTPGCKISQWKHRFKTVSDFGFKWGGFDWSRNSRHDTWSWFGMTSARYIAEGPVFIGQKWSASQPWLVRDIN